MQTVSNMDILTDAEADSLCRHTWVESPVFKCVNPNRGFVRGYGNGFVYVQTGNTLRCPKCGRRKEKV